MPWKAILLVLVLAVVCPACSDVEEPSATEKGGPASSLGASFAAEGVGGASDKLTSSKTENDAPDKAYNEEDASEQTGEAALADDGYPEVRNPRGDGGPDDHTYTGGPG